MPAANARLRRELCVFDFIEHVDCTMHGGVLSPQIAIAIAIPFPIPIPVPFLFPHAIPPPWPPPLPYGNVLWGGGFYAALNLEEIVSHYDEHLWQSWAFAHKFVSPDDGFPDSRIPWFDRLDGGVVAGPNDDGVAVVIWQG